MSKIVSRSRPQGRRAHPSGADSKARILEAAGRLFARDGFDAVTVRAIAARAAVNIAAIGYHFGGKQGLYHAVLRRLIDDTAPIVHPAAAALHDGVAAPGADRAALARLMAGFVRGTLSALLQDKRLRWQHQLLVREFGQPSSEFPMLLDELIHPVHDAVAKVVARATGSDAKSPETLLLTLNIVGQCMIYGIAREVVFARMGWDDYTSARVEAVIAASTMSVQRALNLPLLAAGGGRTA